LWSLDQQGEIRSRLARFAETRDARDVWPDVSVSSFRAAQKAVARATTAVLSDAARPIPLRPTADADARALGVAAYTGGIGPLLGYWCESERLAAHPAVAGQLATALDHGRRRAARMRQALEAVVAGLAERGIDVCVLRSAHTRQRYFRDPGTRTSADIDLLVRPNDWDAAGSTLRGAGYTEAAGRWTPPGVPAVPRSLDFAHADDPWSVHLHRTLDPPSAARPQPTLDTPDLSACEPWDELGSHARVLPQPLLLAHLAVRTSSHFGAIMLVRLVELVLVVRRDFMRRPDAWLAFDELVARTGTGSVVFPALELAEQLAPGTVAAKVRDRLAAAVPVRLRRLVRGATPATALQMHPLPPSG